MQNLIQVLKPGYSTTVTANPGIAGLIGTLAEVTAKDIVTSSAGALLSAQTGIGADDTVILRLVQASASITSAAKQALLWNGNRTQVSAVAGAAALTAAVAGFALLGGTGSANAASGDVFWVVVRGPVIVTAAAAFTAANDLAQHAGPGLDDATVAYDTVLAYSIAAAGGAGDALVTAVIPA